MFCPILYPEIGTVDFLKRGTDLDMIHVLNHISYWRRKGFLKGSQVNSWMYKIWITSIYPIISSVQSLSHIQLFATPLTAARQASLSFTNSQNLLNLMYIESVIPSNNLILCHNLLLLPSVFLSFRVFSNKSVLHIRWPKDWSFSFSISPSNEYPGLIPLGWTGWIILQYKGLLRVFSKTTVQRHQFLVVQLSLKSNSYLTRDYRKNNSFDYVELCCQSNVSAF